MEILDKFLSFSIILGAIVQLAYIYSNRKKEKAYKRYMEALNRNSNFKRKLTAKVSQTKFEEELFTVNQN